MKTIVVSADKTGHVNQCLAVCEALSWTPDEIVRIPAPGRMTPWLERRKLLIQRAIATWRATPRAQSKTPLRILASGSSSEPVVAAYRALHQAKLFAVFSGMPSWREPIFDIALAPRHSLPETDRLNYVNPAARQTVLRRGVPVRVGAEADVERVGTFAMVGGVNKAYEIDPEPIAAAVAAMLRRETPRPFTLTFSRRTPADVEARLRRSLSPLGVAFIARDDRAGFERALAAAGEYVVTPDSLTMICEACDTGRPVRVFDLKCFDPASTTAVCVRDLLDGGEIALAPHGQPLPQQPGKFRVPAAVREAYAEWLAGRSV